MALAKTVNLFFPKEGSRKTFTLGVHLEITDDDRGDLGAGAQTVIEEDVTTTYAEGDSKGPIKNTVLERAQALVDKYKAERVIWDDSTYNQLDNYVNTNLVL